MLPPPIHHARPARPSGRTVVLVHYHLRVGGVTSIIRRQAAGLQELGYQVAVASGDAPGDDWPADLPVRLHPRLGYHGGGADAAAEADLARFLQDAAGPGGVLHFHNPTLGKSGLWPGLLARLRLAGQPMLWQVHDFYEDGRDPGLRRFPDRHLWYPDADHLRWLTVNPEDRAILIRAGLAPDSIVCLANPVAPAPPDTRPIDRRLMVYPVRGIRRKNVGEFLLLAALAPSGWRFALTLAPEDPRQARRFHRWQKWSRALGLPVRLGGGWPESRPAWTVATSIQEGFGLAWVEPWARGIPTTGRWLDRAGGLLDSHGWQSPAAYSRILVPASWLPARHLRARVEQAIKHAAPENPAVEAAVEAVWQKHFAASQIDFARLPEISQRALLRRLATQPEAARHLRFVLRDGRPVTPAGWFQALDHPPDAAMDHNTSLLADPFSITGVARSLARQVEAVAVATPRLHGHADASMIGQSFRDPEFFHFLRFPP